MRIAAVFGGMMPRRKRRMLGALLSALALYIQILLPLIVATELRVAEAEGSGFAGFAICGAGNVSTPDDGGASGAPATGGSHSPGCCPLCVALGGAAPYTAPAEFFIPVRPLGNDIFAEAANVVVIRYDAAPNYQARAPPLNS